jgi:hypothetical protein
MNVRAKFYCDPIGSFASDRAKILFTLVSLGEVRARRLPAVALGKVRVKAHGITVT